MALTRSKSLFAGSAEAESHGYLSPAKLSKVVSAVDDEDEPPLTTSRVSEDPEGVSSPQEGPFSALTSSMWPHWDASEAEKKPKNERGGEESVEYDEFGFKLEHEDGPEHCSSALLGPFKDDPKKKLEWMAHMEFAQSGDTLAWDTMVQSMSRTEKLRYMHESGLIVKANIKPIVSEA